MFDTVSYLESKFGISLHQVTATEWAGPCPKCGGEDRFRVWPEAGNSGTGSFWCRQCGWKGFCDSLDEGQTVTPEEMRLRRIEAEQRRQARELEETKRRLSALEQMAQCKDHLQYHNLMDKDDYTHWERDGIWPETADSCMLGVCYSCPLDHQHRPSRGAVCRP